MNPKSALCAVAVVALATHLAATPARAQADFPSHPIRMIVGFGAGGGNDIFARLVGQKLEQEIGGTVIVENKPGAGGRIAADYVAHQPADGYTILVGASGQMSVAAAIYPKLTYHPLRSFIPLTMIAHFPLILCVPESTPIKTVAELVAYGKAHPDQSNYATSSPAFTITTELFKLKTGMPAQPIPYKSSNESLLSVVAKQTLFTIADGAPAMPLVNGEKIRAIAVTGSERSSELPNVPTMAEAGFPAVNITLWSGLFVPAGTPTGVVKKLEAASRKAIEDPGVSAKLKVMAVTPGGGPGADFAKRIETDITTYGNVAKAANLTFE